MAEQEKNLTQKTFSGLIWKFAERIGAQVVSTVVSIILARLLMPEDYGIVSLVTIFITLCNVFVVSGFGSALIQKKDADEVDFSSVFYASIVIALLLYALLFFTAPLIAKLYDDVNAKLLVAVLRVMGLRLPIAAINSVQQAYVSRRMAFRKFFWATLFGTIASAVVGIWMAYSGYGVWALVAQYLTNVCIDTIILFIVDRWHPRLKFSFQRLKGLLSYGWKLLASSLLNTGYGELRSLVIGIKYSATDLAYYDKGKTFPGLIVTNIDSSIDSVLFSALSKVQDDRVKVKNVVRKGIRTSSYVIFPCMVGLAVIAEAFVRVVLTDKWLPIVPFLQIMCFVYALQPIHTANLQAIKALGRSDLFLILEIAKKAMGITLLLVSMWFGVIWIAASSILGGIIGSFINAFPNKKLLNYGYFEQIKDLLPALLLSLVMGGIVYCIGFIPWNSLIILIVQILVGITIYIGGSFIFKLESFHFILKTIKSFFKHKKERVEAVSNDAEDIIENTAPATDAGSATQTEEIEENQEENEA